jgi:hypothetical protein
MCVVELWVDEILLNIGDKNGIRDLKRFREARRKGEFGERDKRPSPRVSCLDM